jgi:hypothetical protein
MPLAERNSPIRPADSSANKVRQGDVAHSHPAIQNNFGVQESELENGDRSPERKCLRSLQSLQLVRARVKYAKIRNTEVRVHCEGAEKATDGETESRGVAAGGLCMPCASRESLTDCRLGLSDEYDRNLSFGPPQPGRRQFSNVVCISIIIMVHGVLLLDLEFRYCRYSIVRMYVLCTVAEEITMNMHACSDSGKSARIY